MTSSKMQESDLHTAAEDGGVEPPTLADRPAFQAGVGTTPTTSSNLVVAVSTLARATLLSRGATSPLPGDSGCGGTRTHVECAKSPLGYTASGPPGSRTPPFCVSDRIAQPER